VYAFWKTAHVLSAAIIFGTGLGIAFFTWFGYRASVRAGDIGALRVVLRYTVIADACFTAPAVVFQAVSGLVLVDILGWSTQSAWLRAVWALFMFGGVCWFPVLVIQARLKREAQGVASVEALPRWFHRWFLWWAWLGIGAFSAAIALYWMMVAKPLPVTG
jgi:uncharacterized membrane protein